jgi:hypothetical protein
MEAVDRLYEREPDAQPWVIRIGHRAVFRLGQARAFLGQPITKAC